MVLILSHFVTLFRHLDFDVSFTNIIQFIFKYIIYDYI